MESVLPLYIASICESHIVLISESHVISIHIYSYTMPSPEALSDIDSALEDYFSTQFSRLNAENLPTNA